MWNGRIIFVDLWRLMGHTPSFKVPSLYVPLSRTQMHCLSSNIFLTGGVCVNSFSLPHTPLVSSTYIKSTRLLRRQIVTGGASEQKLIISWVCSNNVNDNNDVHPPPLLIIILLIISLYPFAPHHTLIIIIIIIILLPFIHFWECWSNTTQIQL